MLGLDLQELVLQKREFVKGNERVILNIVMEIFMCLFDWFKRCLDCQFLLNLLIFVLEELGKNVGLYYLIMEGLGQNSFGRDVDFDFLWLGMWFLVFRY